MRHAPSAVTRSRLTAGGPARRRIGQLGKLTYPQLIAKRAASSSLIGWWRLGETNGAANAADSSGHGLTGVYTGAPTLGVPGLVPGDLDTAMHVDGTGAQYMEVSGGNGNQLDAGAPAFTAVALFDPSDVAGLDCIVSRDFFTLTRHWQLFVSAGRLRFIVYNASGGALDLTGTTPIGAGERHIAHLTYDGATVNAYLDGALEITGALGNPTLGSNTPLDVGMARANTGGGVAFPFVGVVDEVVLYGSTLPASEVLKDARAVGLHL